jgi:hypothetical protein
MEIQIINAETGEVIIREMTPEEVAQWEADRAVFEAEAKEIETKEAARAALLDKLGITEDEAKLLLGGN